MGATWNRYGNAGIALGEDWPRTLAHELGHYALYQDDDYFGLECAGTIHAGADLLRQHHERRVSR